jgi:hypothetical protein
MASGYFPIKPSSVVKRTLAFSVALLASVIGGLPLSASAMTVVAEWLVPDHCSGLAWDGHRLWLGGIGDNGGYLQIFDADRGAVVDTVPAPVADCFGLDWLDDALAYLSPNSDSTILIAPDGSQRYIPNPYSNMCGLAGDNGTLWSSSYFNPARTLFQMDERGRVLNSTPFLGRHCRDMALHGGLLYAADRITHEIRVINPATGRLVDTFETPGVNPSGLASDGEYLWLLDDGDKPGYDNLYKLAVRDDAGGIRFSELYHNYGSVVINELETWSVWIYNDGLRTAQLLDFEAQDGNDDIFVPHVWAFPEEIAPGDSVRLQISFQPAYPDSAHIFFAIMYDLDRVTNYLNLRGKGVRAGRQISVQNRSLDFGSTRTGRYVRSSNLRYLEVENSGGEALTIQRLNFSDAQFTAGIYEFPYIMDKPGLIQIPIYFKPTQDANIRGTLTIVSDDPNSPEIIVSLAGRGIWDDYAGGHTLWKMQLGDQDGVAPRVRSVIGMDDITGDGLSDIVIATNDHQIRAYHAASSIIALPVWSYNTSTNPWRSGLVWGKDGLSWGDDWNADGINDIVVGLEGDAMSVVALSGLNGERLWQFDTHGHRWGGGRIRIVGGTSDLDGDGISDVYAAAAAVDGAHNTNALFMLEGSDGDMQWVHELDSAPRWVKVIRDVTGDGLPDLITLCDDGKLICMDGRRGRTVWEITIEGDRRDIDVIEDINGDGSQDLAVVTHMNGISMVNGSNGDLIWRLPAGEPDYNVRYLTCCIALNDVNGNGTPDFVVGDAERFAWCIDGATQELAWYEPVIAGTEVRSLARLSDLNHDGIDDFLMGTVEGRIFCLSGVDGHSLWTLSNPGDGHSFDMAVGTPDVDGNGYMDAIGVMANGTVYCFAGSYIGDTVSVVTSDKPELPQTLVLEPAYPNPFNSVVVLPVRLAARGDVVITVTDLLGRTCFQEIYPSLAVGEHRFLWNGRTGGASAPSGTYIVRVAAADARQQRLITLTR